MSDLPRPLRTLLRDPTDEGTADRVLRGVDFSRAGRRGPSRAGLSGLALAAAACALLLLRPAPPREPGPLLLPDGSALVELAGNAEGAGGERSVTLSDGTAVTLGAGARLRTTRNDGRGYAAALTGGGGRFRLAQGGARRWSIDCGELAVDAVGADFEVSRTPDRLTVTVRRGAVALRGEAPRALRAGESFALALRTPAATATAGAPAAPPPAPGSSPVAAAPAQRPAAARPAVTWRALAARGRWRDAYDTLGGERIAQATRSPEATAEELLAMADVARLSGHPAEAVAPLARVVERHRGDPAASLAALTLGRVELDALGRPEAAARALRTALALGVPASLEEDAHARLVEALARAGDADGARRAAEAYRARFPAGRRAAEVERLVGR